MPAAKLGLTLCCTKENTGEPPGQGPSLWAQIKIPPNILSVCYFCTVLSSLRDGSMALKPGIFHACNQH